MRNTLVFIRHHEINGRQFRHAEELPPGGTLTQENVNQLLDQKILVEAPDRRGIYRLLHRFSGCKEQEQLTKEESATYALSP